MTYFKGRNFKHYSLMKKGAISHATISPHQNCLLEFQPITLFNESIGKRSGYWIKCSIDLFSTGLNTTISLLV